MARRPDTASGPPLDQPHSEPPTCKGTTKTGERCSQRIVDSQGLCAVHSGAVQPGSGAAAKAAKNAAAREAIEHRTALAKMGLRAQMALRLAERQDEVVALLVDRPLDEGDAQTVFRALSEALGKPGEAAPPVLEPGPTLEDLVEAWAAVEASMPPEGEAGGGRDGL